MQDKLNIKAEKWMREAAANAKLMNDPNEPYKVNDILENLGEDAGDELSNKDQEYLMNKYSQHGDMPIEHFDAVQKLAKEPMKTDTQGVKKASEIDPLKAKGSMTGPETAEPVPPVDKAAMAPQLDAHQKHAENTFNKVKSIMSKKPVTDGEIIQAIKDKNLVNPAGLDHLHSKYMGPEMSPEQQIQAQDEVNSENGNPWTSPENQ